MSFTWEQFHRDHPAVIWYNELENYSFKFTATSPKGQWVNYKSAEQSIGTDVTLVHSVWSYCLHYSDIIMDVMASQITSLTIVYSTVCSDADQRGHQSSASLAFVRGIHRSPVNSPHIWPVTWKMFPFDDVIMWLLFQHQRGQHFSGQITSKTGWPNSLTGHSINLAVQQIKCQGV